MALPSPRWGSAPPGPPPVHGLEVQSTGPHRVPGAMPHRTCDSWEPPLQTPAPHKSLDLGAGHPSGPAQRGFPALWPVPGGGQKLKRSKNAFFGSASSAPFERYVARVSEMQTLRLETLAKKGPKWPRTPVFRGLRGEKTPKNFPRPPSGRPAPMVESLQRGGGDVKSQPGPAENGGRGKGRGGRIDTSIYTGD